MIIPSVKEVLYKYIDRIVTNRFNGILFAIGGIEDHIHILVCLPARHSASEFVRVVKSNTSRFINESRELDYIFSWQKGYSGFVVSTSLIAKTQRYVANQKEHHKDKEYEEELVLLLTKNEIAYDKNSLLD